MKRRSFNWVLPAEIENRLGDDTYGRQRTIREKDHLLIILHTPPESENRTRHTHVFLRQPDGKLLGNGSDQGPMLMKRLLLTYRDLLETFERNYKKAKGSEDLYGILEKLIPVNRASCHLYETLQKAREQAHEDKFLIAMRDEAYEIHRGYELLLADARLSLDYRLAQNAEEQVARAQETLQAQHRLNILAAVTFPLMAVATLFGMNLVHGMENVSPILFWLVVVVALFIGFSVKGWVTKKKSDDNIEVYGER